MPPEGLTRADLALKIAYSKAQGEQQALDAASKALEDARLQLTPLLGKGTSLRGHRTVLKTNLLE